MIHIQDRDPALEEIHSEDVEDEQQKYSHDDDIIDEFYEIFFDQDIDRYQSEQDQAYQEITDERAQIMYHGPSPGRFLKDLSIGQKNKHLFKQQTEKREHYNSPPEKRRRAYGSVYR